MSTAAMYMNNIPISGCKLGRPRSRCSPHMSSTVMQQCTYKNQFPSRSIQSGQHNTLPFRALGPSAAPFTLTTRKPFPDIPGTYSYKTNMHNILRDAHGMAARKQAGPVSPTLTE